MPKPLRAHFRPETITITSTIELVRSNDQELRKWKGHRSTGEEIVCLIPDWVTFDVIEDIASLPKRQPASANRLRSEKAKRQWQKPLEDVKAAGIRIRGKRPTKTEARTARQKLARQNFKAIMPQLTK